MQSNDLRWIEHCCGNRQFYCSLEKMPLATPVRRVSRKAGRVGRNAKSSEKCEPDKEESDVSQATREASSPRRNDSCRLYSLSYPKGNGIMRSLTSAVRSPPMHRERALFLSDGQSALSPGRLTLVSIQQFRSRLLEGAAEMQSFESFLKRFSSENSGTPAPVLFLTRGFSIFVSLPPAISQE